MKNQRPILFSTPMVQAILKDRKTQTRRVLKCDHPAIAGFSRAVMDENLWLPYAANPEIRQQYVTTFPFGGVKCPFGKVGDLLWVRETFRAFDAVDEDPEVIYKADGGEIGCFSWKPSIFMPKWISRITLEIVNIRVEKLKDISSTDAIAEGIESSGDFGYKDYSGKGGVYCNAPRPSYFSLWDSINGKGAADKNPWVWVLEFKVHRQNVDKM